MRLFSTLQRHALWWFAGGKCAECSQPLGRLFHADHVVPHSRGGKTVLTNGQALCPPCNLKKGNKTMPILHATRPWQVQCLSAIGAVMQQNGHDFIANVTPSGGKTLLGLEFAYQSMAAKQVDAVVIVAPSENIRNNWVAQAARYPDPRTGIAMTGQMKLLNGFIDPTMAGRVDGFVTTYQWLAANAPALAQLCGSCRAMFIADEVHHGGLGKPWGDSVHQSTAGAVFRLGLSGTPFRTDDCQIPFLHYSGNNGVPHYEYTYGDALMDGVVAPVYFRWLNGSVEMHDPQGNVDTFSFDESAGLEEAERARLLSAATAAGTQFSRALLAEAHAELSTHCATDPAGALKSGGLVMAQNIQAAEAARDYLKNVLGASTVLITSDSVSAQADLRAFVTSGDEWLVSVAMVSEGVDIPRLKVLAFVTDERTELRFVQAVGRISRLLPGRGNAPQDVFFYAPKLSDYEGYAAVIETARNHVLGVAGGAALPPPMRVCVQCGTQNTPPAKHCSCCGLQFPARGAAGPGAVVLNTDGNVDGLTLRGHHFTEQNLDEAIFIFAQAPSDYGDLVREGRALWVGKYLLATALYASQVGLTSDAQLAAAVMKTARSLFPNIQ